MWKIIALMELEGDITKNMETMGYSGQITFTDITREIRKDQDLTNRIMQLIDIKNKHIKKIKKSNL